MPSTIAHAKDDNSSPAAVDVAPSTTSQPASADGDDSSLAEFRIHSAEASETPAPMSQTELAVLDILEGARAWRLWGSLGWQDIRQRYRRSKIGPFWVTLSMGVMIAGMGFLYADLFHTDVHSYLPYLTTGMIIWGLIGPLVTENCNAFIDGEGIIKQVKLPLSLHVYRVIWRNLIIFGHNFIIFILVAVVMKIWPGWSVLMAIPGLLMICINGAWVGLLWGPVSARFRDVPQIVASIMQIVFFMTPIMWNPSAVAGRRWFLELNPFYYFVTLVRQPLLGGEPTAHLWQCAIAITAGGWIIAFLMYRRCRWRIAYWL
jgi:ABC-type polysaccharide/polyol phosphate export permease